MGRRLAGSAVVLALMAASCGSGHRPGAAAPPATTSTTRPAPTTISRPAPTTTRPAATATMIKPVALADSLPAPRPIAPLVSPPFAGEGVWQPTGDPVGRAYAIYTTHVQAAPGASPAGLAWMDPRLARFSLYAGVGQPDGAWPQEAGVSASDQRQLLGAFNGGFKIYDYRTGWYDQGRTAMPLVAGVASLVIYANGTATVGDWGRDVSLSPGVVAVRQNLPLLVDHGAVGAAASNPATWGAVLGGGTTTWRSGLGVTASGALVYAGGPDLLPSQLGSLLVAAGAVRAMQLDINPEWVVFAAYHHPGGLGSASLDGSDLVPGMYFPPSHFLASSSRDFVALFARS